jgi:hypothetical protein
MRRPACLLAAALLLPTLARAEDPKPAEWKGTVGAGLILMTGNSQTTTFTGSGAASRETMGWILSAKAAGAYGENRAAPAGLQTNAYNAAGQLRLDRKIPEIWSVYLLGGLETDHIASVELRGLVEPGVSAQWIDVKEADWQKVGLRTDVGFRWATEKRYRYYPTPGEALPGADLVAPRLGLAFRYAFSKEVFFTEDAEILPNVVGDSRVLVKSLSKLSSRLGKSVTTGISYAVAHDSRPAVGKKKTDGILTAVVEVGF